MRRIAFFFEDRLLEVKTTSVKTIVRAARCPGRCKIPVAHKDYVRQQSKIMSWVNFHHTALLRKCVFLVCAFVGLGHSGLTQSLSGPEMVTHYTPAQKRLLVNSTTTFLLAITPTEDKDSLMLMAEDLYHLGFLTPYTEGLQNTNTFSGTSLVNASRITEAKQLLQNLVGEQRIQLLLDLGTWYLHQAGERKADLDEANRYIQEAIRSSKKGADKNLYYNGKCLEGEWQYQSGKLLECRITFKNLIALSQQEKNTCWEARCYQHLSEVLNNSDSAKLFYLTKSRELYRNIQQKEREIEVLWQIFAYHDWNDEYRTAQKRLEEVLQLQEVTRFKHSLFALYELSEMQSIQTKYVEALQTAQAALANHQWSGLSAISSYFYRRLGVVYQYLNKPEEALYWYRKGLENRSLKTHLFWYTSLVWSASLLTQMNRQQEALNLMDSIVREYPPITLSQKIMVARRRGNCYAGLNLHTQADREYMTMLNFYQTANLPEVKNIFANTLRQAAEYYLRQGDIAKARLFTRASFEVPEPNKDARRLSFKYSLLYKIDSAEGNYKLALNNYRRYQAYRDSFIALDQRKQLEELNLKYNTEKKDQNIKLLTERTKAQQATLKQKTLFQNLILSGSALLLVILGLLFNQYRIKKRSSETVAKKNKALRHLLTEKEWLVKEIHHRVKNNLQIVMSLLNSQTAFVDNPFALSAILDSQHRVHAMSLLHQKLYSSENVTAVDVSIYIRELVSYLSASFPSGQHVRFEYRLEPVELDVGQAIPLGLILNEAITNSLKYAYPDGRSGTISLSLSCTEAQRCWLVIADNGIGIQAETSNKRPDSLGMSLMQGLSKDLDGSFSIENNNGTLITISFLRDRSVQRLEDQNTSVVSNN
jgi:two-component sensor histidine kinase